MFVVWHEFFDEVDIYVNNAQVFHDHNIWVTTYYGGAAASGGHNSYFYVHKGDNIRIVTSHGYIHEPNTIYPYPILYVNLYPIQ